MVRPHRGSLAIVAAPSAAATTSSMRGADAGLDGGEDGALDERRLADPDPGPVGRLELLERQLQAERRAAEIEQHEHARRRPRRARTGAPRRCAARSCPGARPRSPGHGHRDVITGDLGDHVAQALDEGRAVGDQDQADQSRLLSLPPVAGWRRCSAAGHQEESKSAARVAYEGSRPGRGCACRDRWPAYHSADRARPRATVPRGRPRPTPAPIVVVDAAGRAGGARALPADRRAPRRLPHPARRRPRGRRPRRQPRDRLPGGRRARSPSCRPTRRPGSCCGPSGIARGGGRRGLGTPVRDGLPRGRAPRAGDAPVRRPRTLAGDARGGRRRPGPAGTLRRRRQDDPRHAAAGCRDPRRASSARWRRRAAYAAALGRRREACVRRAARRSSGAGAAPRDRSIGHLDPGAVSCVLLLRRSWAVTRRRPP